MPVEPAVEPLSAVVAQRVNRPRRRLPDPLRMNVAYNAGGAAVGGSEAVSLARRAAHL